MLPECFSTLGWGIAKWKLLRWGLTKPGLESRVGGESLRPKMDVEFAKPEGVISASALQSLRNRRSHAPLERAPDCFADHRHYRCLPGFFLLSGGGREASPAQ